MDRLNQLRAGAGGSAGGGGDATLDASSPPSEAFLSANESSKYFSLSDSTFDITPIKDVSLASVASAHEPDHSMTDDLMSNLSPITKKDVMLDSFKIGTQIEAANILSGGVNIFDDNDNSFDGNELVIDDNVDMDEKTSLEKESHLEEASEATLVDSHVDVGSKDTEVVLQIDGKNVDAIDIGNGLYLYRKEGQEELAAVQIITDDNQQAPTFKFLKVRENVEGNLEVYEEFEIEVSKDAPVNEAKPSTKTAPHVPNKDINKALSHLTNKIVAEKKDTSPPIVVSSTSKAEIAEVKEAESKTEVNFNGKMMKISECRKSPVVGSFTPMTYLSTPNKEGKPLTKTMVDQQLHPSRHSDNAKKTIEVHTDSQKKQTIDENKSKSETIEGINDVQNKETENESKAKSETIEGINDSQKKETVNESKAKSETIEVYTYGQKNQTVDESNTESKLIEVQTDSQKKQKTDGGKTKSETVEVHTDSQMKHTVGESQTKSKTTGDRSDKQKRQPVGGSKPKSEIIEEHSDNQIKKDNNERISTSETINNLTDSLKKQDTDNSKLKNETMEAKGGKIEDNLIVTKELQTNKEIIMEKSKSQNKNNLTLEASGSSASSNMVKKSTKHENKTKLEHLSEVNINDVTKVNILNPTNVDCKVQKTNVIPSSEIVSKDWDTKKLEDRLKPKVSNSPTKSIPDLVKISFETEVRNVNPITEKVAIKSDTLNKDDSGSANLNSVKADQTPEMVNVEKEIKIHTKVQEATSSSIDLISKNHHEEITTQLATAKESSDIINAVSSTSSDHKKFEIPIEIATETKAKTTTVGISTSETAKSISFEYKTVSYLSESPKGSEQKAVLETEKIKPVMALPTENVTDRQSENYAYQTELKVETKAVLNKENTIIIDKNTEPKTALKSDETSTAVLTETTIELEKKIEPRAIPPMNKFIQVPKRMKLLIVPKAGAPIENEVELTPLAHSSLAAAAKLNEPKTNSKTDRFNPISKIMEPKSVPPVIQPITKGFELKTVPKTVPLNPAAKVIDSKIAKVDKPELQTQQIPKNKAVIITSNQIIVPGKLETANIGKVTTGSEAKPINNNHAAVPFGKWTDANRQEFLSKFKEIKVPASSTTKQIKNSNDLNRIDVLKKIDSQRTKAQDKSNLKDTLFSNPPKDTKLPVKGDGFMLKAKPVDKPESTSTEAVSSTVPGNANPISQTEEARVVNFNDLIGRAIVDMLNRPVAMRMTRSPLDEPRQVDKEAQNAKINEAQNLNIDQPKLNVEQQKQKAKIDQTEVDPMAKVDHRKTNAKKQKKIEQKNDEDSSGSLDDIEMKMNELHGIPFVERPVHELPKVHKTYSKSGKDKSKGAKKLLPATSKKPLAQDNIIELESDEEIIEHEPITGDMLQSNKIEPVTVKSEKTAPKETAKEVVITENDFDKFARRNSKTYENCLTVKFDGKESSNVVQCVKEKEGPQKYSLNNVEGGTDCKTVPAKQVPAKMQSKASISKLLPNTKFGSVPDEPNNKKSKIHTAYQSALTAKRQMDRPITIIEDKPVKVVFIDANTEFIPNQLNVQGKELSPAKNASVESVNLKLQPVNLSTETTDEKQQDDTKTKAKHQRKQVLTSVETPELELIQPRDFDVSPKKKRRTEDNKTEKGLKTLVHKKSYLLGRTGLDEIIVSQDVTNSTKETINQPETATDRTVSAIDSLVKAAELLENQSVQHAIPNTDSPQQTAVKRGRGRPRKNALPDGTVDSKEATPSPQKKLRLIDAKPVKKDVISDEEISDNEQMIRENWTMGKINENIVCPICNKLFRSENVVFKHVKHCTGVSPTRSDLEKRRKRYSEDSDSQSEDMEFEEKPKPVRKTPKKLNSNETVRKESPTDADIIIIEDTPVKKTITETEPKKSKPIEEKQMKPKQVKSVTEVASKPIEEKQIKPKQVKSVTEVASESQEKVKKLDEKPKREPTLQEIANEKLISKQLEKKASEEKSNEAKIVKEPKKKKTSLQRSSNLVCEFCGKSFRQLSYLANHKLQHKKEQQKLEKLTAKLQVFSCEVCKKEFRKLHHLVQHRIIHNPEVPTRSSRKSSSEQTENKAKEMPAPKQNDDTSAGFRCEPCDKSFRKLHHLVEHRETHDGINRQKSNAQTIPQTIEKPPPPPQCDVCKKTFRKLHHLIEHQEQHHMEQIETSSEKSDDKSAQSSLATRDIIHECSLCYMVFPNEHSLNKHFVFCQKKRQSKAKDKPENLDVAGIAEETTEDSTDAEDEPQNVAEVLAKDEKGKPILEQEINLPDVEKTLVSEKPEMEKTLEEKPVKVPDVPKPKDVIEVKSPGSKRELSQSNDNTDAKKIIPEKIKKLNETKVKLPKKSIGKDKLASTVTKRQKSIVPLPVLPEDKPAKPSDEDEVRYMLNPNFKNDVRSEEKVFMKVRSNKRNSLQIEQPNSRDLMNRRTSSSVQHPPKIPRLKAKAVEPKDVPIVTKNIPKPKNVTAEQAASTDSDDSDVKYSFPETVVKKTAKPKETPKEIKAPRKSMTDKRKSLSGIAKRKSGQGIAKLKAGLPVRVIKRRTLDVEHRCDCGQLFNSAALLSRHTSLAHTPPRIRRNRSPPLETSQPQRKSTVPAKSNRNSSVRSETASKPTRKSSAKSDSPATRKFVNPESQEKKSSVKPKANAAHRGVPVPEKMRKLMMKNVK